MARVASRSSPELKLRNGPIWPDDRRTGRPPRHLGRRQTVEASRAGSRPCTGSRAGAGAADDPRHREETRAVASSIPFAWQSAPAEPAVADLALGEQLVIWALRKRLA